MAVFLLGTQSIKKRFEIRKGQREVTKVVRVRSTDPPTPLVESEVELAIAIALGDPYPTDPGMTCSGIDIDLGGVQQRKTIDGIVCWDWQASVTWSSREGNDPNDHKDPTQRPPKITVSIEQYGAPARLDLLTGLVPQNSAEDPFVREMKRARPVFRIEKFFESFRLDWAQEISRDGLSGGFVLSRNAAPWSPAGPYSSLLGSWSIPAGQALLAKLEPNVIYENGRYYVQVQAEIHTDIDESKDIVIDQGFFAYKFDGAGNAVKGPIFEDRSGMPTTVPQLLNGLGSELGPGLEPFELEFQYYPTTSWTPLGLP